MMERVYWDILAMIIVTFLRSINISPGDGGSHGIVVNGNGPVLINSITAGSAAEKAGLMMYDFIIKVINVIDFILMHAVTGAGTKRVISLGPIP